MSSYKPLKRIFHMKDSAAADSAYRHRVTSEATLTWGFTVGGMPLFCMMTPDLVTALTEIHARELDVRSWSQSLPEEAIVGYFREQVIAEILATNDIEGVRSTRAEVQFALREAERDRAHSEARLTEFVGLYMDLWNPTAGSPRTLHEIRDVYDAVTRGEIDPRDRPDGELFRRSPVHITDGGQTKHTGLTPETAIATALRTMMAAAERDDVPALVRAVVGHFMFEYVHPFYDGNGRTGRYLLSQEVSRVLSPLTAMRLSRKVNQQKSVYLKAFDSVEDPLNRGDVTLFVLPLVHLIGEAQSELVEDLADRRHRWDTVEERIARLEADGELTPEEAGHLTVLAQSHLFSDGGTGLGTLVKCSSKGKATVRKRLSSLEALGLVSAAGKPLVFRLTRQGRDLLNL